MDDRIGEKLHLGGVVTVTDQVLPVGGDVVGTDNFLQFVKNSHIKHRLTLFQ